MSEESVLPPYKPAVPDVAHQRALRIIKGTAAFDDRFIPDHTEMVELINSLRAMGCVIVFTTGVWDLFHVGHALYIERGREEASGLYPHAEHIITVVGVDTDKLTKERKGPERPIVPEDERVRVLGSLRSVDILTLQYQSDQLFKVVPHDVRVVSSSTKDLPDEERMRSQCEHIVNLPPQAETSTTARVRRLAFDGGVAVLAKVEKSLTTMLEEVRGELSP